SELFILLVRAVVSVSCALWLWGISLFILCFLHFFFFLCWPGGVGAAGGGGGGGGGGQHNDRSLPGCRPALICSALIICRALQKSELFAAQEGDVKWKSLNFAGALLAATGVLLATDALADADWPSAGADLSNSRYQATEKRIKATSVGSLQQKWVLATVGDVQAHPAVDGNYLYFPDSAGFLYKVDKTSGTLIWKVKICHYTGTASQSAPLDQCAAGDPFASDSARGTPAVAGDL